MYININDELLVAYKIFIYFNKTNLIFWVEPDKLFFKCTKTSLEFFKVNAFSLSTKQLREYKKLKVL